MTHMHKITGFTDGPTSSGAMRWYAAILDCGHWHYSRGWYPFPPEITVGTEIDCGTCADHAAAVARLEAMDLSNILYFRFDTRWAYPEQGIAGQYRAYQREPSSPTGVQLAGSFPAIPAIDAIIDKRRICALSPTEYRPR